jgi:hypothetical protein
MLHGLDDGDKYSFLLSLCDMISVVDTDGTKRGPVSYITTERWKQKPFEGSARTTRIPSKKPYGLEV